MKRVIIFLFLIWQFCPGFAQVVNILNDKQQHLSKFAVLPDRGYTFERVHNDRSLNFKQTDSLLNASVYWLKVILYNPSHKPVNFKLAVYPNYDNTLFYYDVLGRKWIAHRSGNINKIPPPQLGVHPYDLEGLKLDTIYIRINVNIQNIVHNSFKAEVLLTPKHVAEQRQYNIYTAWIVGIVIVLLFFLNNLYIFFSFKDKSVGYYLIIQLGGMMYLSAYWYFFGRLFGYHVFSLILSNYLHSYDLDNLALHGAIIIIFYGFIQLTRSYLNTSMYLPVCDRMLKYGLYTYIILSIIIAIINLSGFHIEKYTLVYDNIFCMLLILTVAYTSVIGYLRQLPTAGSFLLANIFPLFFMCGVTLFHLFITTEGVDDYWLPILAVASQALSFSIALVARTKTMQAELQQKEIESRQFAFDLKEIAYQNQLIEKEILQANADIKSEKYRNELLHERVQAHQRELASSTLFMIQKNELLAHLKNQIRDLKRTDRYNAGKNLNEMIVLLENNSQLDTDWHKFKLHFEQVHPNFFEDLKKQHATLTQRETRLYAYFEMKLSHKEIAALLNIDQASVRRAKTRLLKKMSLSASEE